MKILYFTDTHDKGRNPGARIDDYHQAIINKFLEIEQIAINEKIDAIVHGGDWFDTPRVANSIINEHQRILRRIRRHGIKVYVVPGNHDLYGYSMSTIAQTSLGILSTSGLVTLLTRRKSYTLHGGNGEIVEIHGREYDIDIDKDIYDYDIDESTSADHNLLFAHGMLLEKPFHPDVRHSLTKDVITDADLVVTGHYHDGYDAHEINDTTFVNIGSTARDEGSKVNLTRKPQYMIIELDRNDFNLDIRSFQCATKGKDIFDRTQIEQHKKHIRHLEAFEQTIDDALAYEAFDPKDILAKTKGIDQALVTQAMDLIIDQEKNHQDSKLDGFIEKKRAIGIKSVKLENFQSHKETEVELNAKGLNALTGASDSGKSAIIRGIRWVLYNEPRGSDFIRHGTSRATVTITFTDDSSITRTRTNSSAGEYIIRTHDGKEETFKGFGNAIPIDVANIHQMPKVELATGIERAINFSYQLDGHFLLSESPATRASTIGRLTGVHLVDGAIKTVAKEIRQITIDTNSSEKRIEELSGSLEQFHDLTEKKSKINLCQALLIQGESLEKTLTEYEDLLTEYNDETDRMKSLKTELKPYDNIDKAEICLLKVESQLRELRKLEELSAASLDSRRAVADVTADLLDYDEIDQGINGIEDISEDYTHLKELKSLYNLYKNSDKNYKELKNDLLHFESLGEFDVNKIESDFEDLKELKELLIKYNSDHEQITRTEVQIDKNNKNIASLNKELEALIDEQGVCPTCNQELTDVETLLGHV